MSYTCLYICIRNSSNCLKSMQSIMRTAYSKYIHTVLIRTNLASLIERLAPLFSVDVLLPRTIISIASLRHLQDIVRSRAFPMDVYCALLHVMVSAGVVTLPEKDRQVIMNCLK